MPGMICVLGDAHLDVVVRRLGPVASDTDTPARTLAGPGGQAANVAAWVAELGGRSRLVYARGTDLAAGLIAADLTARGVVLAGPVVPGSTGVVVSLSDGGTQRSMLTDRGVGPRIRVTDVRESWLEDCDWLHLPAYSLVSEPVGGAARALAATARDRSVRLSIDLSSTTALTGFGPAAFTALLAGLRPDVIFGNAAEAALISAPPGADLVVKLGPAGVLIGGRRYPAADARAVDSTGAGDAFAAGYLLGGVSLGLAAAARSVSKMGGMP
jgi:sugar/nucleoside kinase (ribokinase family)